MTSPSGWRTGCGTAASPTRRPGWPGPAGTWTPAWPRPSPCRSTTWCSRLLERLSATPVATELVTGASVYRVPVDDTALPFQPASRPDPPAEPERAWTASGRPSSRQPSSGDGGQISLETPG